VGLRDYYRRFEGLSEDEVNRGLRAEAAERKRRALHQLERLDLSSTTWHELPHPRVVGAVTYVARRGLHSYPHQRNAELRSELAHRHSLEPNRVAVGNGAAQLLSAAAHALIEPGQELITRWPSYPLYPIMARRAGGRAVPVSGRGVDGVLAAVGERTRLVALASPDDPSGELIGCAELERLLSALPERVAVLLDQALIDFADAEQPDACLALLADHPRLLVFRSFSKAWGLAGLRCGYAVGGPGAEELLAALEPELGVGELTQAGALESLRSCAQIVARRARAVAQERDHLIGALRERGLDVADSQANFVWAAHPRLRGAELAAHLQRARVLVAAGAPLGDPGRVRVTVRDRAASERLLRALDAGG
jgi:histidinol-phosphate aminotransferase